MRRRPGRERPARRGETMRPRAVWPARAPAPAGPPRAVRASVACSLSTPTFSRAAITSASSTRPKWMILHREPSVAGRSSSESATRTNAVVALGSSSVLSRALAAPSLITPASSNTKTFRADSTGARVAWAMVVRAWLTVSMVRPSGSTMFTSGWLPEAARRHDEHSPSCAPPVGHTNRAAKARATVPLPTPSGPTNRYAWAGEAGSEESIARVRRCPTTESNGWAVTSSSGLCRAHRTLSAIPEPATWLIVVEHTSSQRSSGGGRHRSR